MMVDEIMGLTGTYATRTKDSKPMGGHPEPFIEQMKPFKSQKNPNFPRYILSTNYSRAKTFPRNLCSFL